MDLLTTSVELMPTIELLQHRSSTGLGSHCLWLDLRSITVSVLRDLISPIVGWCPGRTNIKLAITLVDGAKRQRPKIRPFPTTLPSPNDPTAPLQLPLRSSQSVSGFPPPLFHYGPRCCHIAVVGSSILTTNFDKELHSSPGQSMKLVDLDDTTVELEERIAAQSLTRFWSSPATCTTAV